MIQASNAYKSAVDGNGRRVQARVYLDGTLLDMPIGEVKLYRGCCGSKPEAGSIYVPYSDVEVKGTIDAAGGTPMQVDIGFMTGSAWEWVTVGSYVVSRIEAQNDKVTIHGIGTIGLFGGQKAVVTETSYSAIATQIGTAVGYDVQFVGLDPSGSFESPPEGTYRDILAQIAFNLGGFLTEDSTGKWTIAGFCSGTAVLVNADRMQEPPSFGYESYSLNGVEVESAEIDLTMGNPLFDPWDYLVFGEAYAKMSIDRSSGNLIVEDGSTVTGDIAFDDNSDGHLLYTYSGEPNVLFTLLREHLIVSQLNSHIVPCLQIVHTLNGGLSTFIGAHVESSTEQEAAIEGVLSRQVIEANEKATEALESVQETTNYFWANEEGAHVTEKPKAEFIANPADGGSNILAKSSGLAIRDGLLEIAQFEGDGITFNMDGYPEILKLHAYTDEYGNSTGSLALGDTGNPSINGYQDMNGDGAIYISASDSLGSEVDPEDPGAGHTWVSATQNDSDGARFEYVEKVSTSGSYQRTYLGLDNAMLLFGSSGPQSYEGQAFTVDRYGNGAFAGGLSLDGGNAVADYVVDQGHIGGWSYRKWNSGVAECSGYTSVISVAYTNQWGSAYYSDEKFFDFPIAFKSGTYPAVTCTVWDNGGLGWATVKTLNYTKVGFYLSNPAKTTRSTQLYIHANGFWK